MSAGHRHGDEASDDELKAALNHPEMRQHLARPVSIDTDHDIPYLGGYSQDGYTIYLDRHLPRFLKVGKMVADAHHLVATHERVEKAAIDGLRADYEKSHELATHVEHSQVSAAGIDPKDYEAALKPYIREAEHESIRNPPRDLDMTPYGPHYTKPEQLISKRYKIG